MKRWVYVAIVVAVIALAYMLLAPKDAAEPEDAPQPERQPLVSAQEKTVATVYYATLDGRYLVPLNININSTTEVAKVAVELLLAGAPNDFVADPITVETKLLDLYTIHDTVYANFTASFADIAPEQMPLAVDALLLTLLPLTDGYKLQILIDGQGLQLFDAAIDARDTTQPLSEPLLNPVAEAEAAEDSRPLTYYLGDGQAMYLVPRTIAVPDTLSAEEQARLILSALLNQSGAEGLAGVLWPGTELLGLELQEGVAVCDFSEQLTAYGGGTAFEFMLVNALVYSLCGVEGIDSVQILIEGEQREYLPEGSDISRPLTISAPLNMLY
ncbi:MAG: GerMN domain-containing protein [Bacillota bacterium]|nr:GerMN domain-containing protein [Bacillota bacterium]